MAHEEGIGKRNDRGKQRQNKKTKKRTRRNVIKRQKKENRHIENCTEQERGYEKAKNKQKINDKGNTSKEEDVKEKRLKE